MVSVMEHGITPTTTVTRMMASYGNPIQVGVAAGLLTVGDLHERAGEQIAWWLREVIAGTDSTRSDHAEEIRVKGAKLRGRAKGGLRVLIGGLVHPHHDVDPRALLLMKSLRSSFV